MKNESKKSRENQMQGELAALHCFGFLHIAAAGSDPWSLDAMRRK